MYKNISVRGNYYSGYRNYYVKAREIKDKKKRRNDDDDGVGKGWAKEGKEREIKDTSSECEFTGLYEDLDGRYILQVGQDEFFYSKFETKDEALQELYDYIDEVLLVNDFENEEE